MKERPFAIILSTAPALAFVPVSAFAQHPKGPSENRWHVWAEEGGFSVESRDGHLINPGHPAVAYDNSGTGAPAALPGILDAKAPATRPGDRRVPHLSGLTFEAVEPFVSASQIRRQELA